jgi:hypothetical protein
MTVTNIERVQESRLRRWWRRFHDVMEAMETSGHGYLDDRIECLEERVRRLEAKKASTWID